MASIPSSPPGPPASTTGPPTVTQTPQTPQTPSTTSTTSTTSSTTSTTSTTSTSLTPIIPLTPSTTSTTSTTLLTTTSSTSVLTTTSTTPSLTPTTPITSIAVVSQVTITSVITPSTSRNVAPTNSADPSNGGSSNGFFQNKGAVAGVFTVVGLIALAILIALITNGIRRRRAKKFDEEIAAAARDAANAQVPNFAYEDDDDFRPGVYGASGGNGTKFSDASHGTYGQPPMSVPESYGMRELPHHGPGPNVGEYFDGGNYGGPAVAGAAGIGVARARSMRDGAYATGLKEGASPYAAFAAPGGNTAHNGTPGPQYPPGMIRGAGGPEFDLNRRPSQYTQQTDYNALMRNKSLNTINSSAPSYQSDPFHSNGVNGAYGQQQGYPNSFGAYATSSPPGVGPNAGGPAHPQIPSSRSEENLDSAYDGYVVDEPPSMHQPTHTHGKGTALSSPGPLPNPFAATGRSAENGDETDDDEIEEPKRVLKVANE